MIREREYVKGMYPNSTWASRVDKMPDDRVLAIYFRLKNIEYEINEEIQEATALDMQLRLF